MSLVCIVSSFIFQNEQFFIGTKIRNCTIESVSFNLTCQPHISLTMSLFFQNRISAAKKENEWLFFNQHFYIV